MDSELPSKAASHFIEDCLRLHNEYRAMHGASALTIDSKLNDIAQQRATYLAEKDYVAQREKIEYGENVFVGCSKDPDYVFQATDPMGTWYQRNKYYVYGEADPANLKVVRNFTQIVWKESLAMGVGVATDSHQKIYVVVVYEPAGNISGQFADNVLPALPEEAEGMAPPPEINCIYQVKPKVRIVASMERIYATPSEELRNWTIWLTKIGDVAYEWQKWLRVHINFMLRLGVELQTIQELMRQEMALADEDVSSISEAVDEDGASEIGGISETTDAATNIDTFDESFVDALNGEEDMTLEENEAPPTEELPADEPPVEELNEEEPPEVGEEESTGEGNESPETDEPSNLFPGRTVRTRDGIKVECPNWPIGTRWTPLPPPEPPEPEPLPVLEIPRNPEEMTRFIKQFTHEATVYASYYKHWKETSMQALKAMLGRIVMSTLEVRGLPVMSERRKKSTMTAPCPLQPADVADLVRAEEDIPYFFFVGTDPDIDIAIEHDDELIILPDPDREHIFGNYERLYFNLIEKPGMG